MMRQYQKVSFLTQNAAETRVSGEIRHFRALRTKLPHLIHSWFSSAQSQDLRAYLRFHRREFFQNRAGTATLRRNLKVYCLLLKSTCKTTPLMQISSPAGAGIYPNMRPQKKCIFFKIMQILGAF